MSDRLPNIDEFAESHLVAVLLFSGQLVLVVSNSNQFKLSIGLLGLVTLV